jgi:hypothetical protein
VREVTHQYREIPEPMTKLQQNHMTVRKVNAIYDMIDNSDGNWNVIRNGIAVLGGPLLKTEAEIQAAIDLIVFLRSIPRSGGIA